jgi:hypothetical protein
MPKAGKPMIATNTRLGYLLSKEYRDMTPEEQQEYKAHKGFVVMNYLGVATNSSDSLRLRTKAWLEETRTGFWD